MKKRISSKLGLTACAAAAALSSSAFAASYVNDFGTGGLGTDGWKSDDTRNSAGVNLIDGSPSGISHAPPLSGGAVNIDDADAIRQQIDWLNSYGTRGNLGGLFLDGTDSGSGKSTLSVIDAAAGFGSTDTILDSDLSVTFRWKQTSTEGSQGPAFRIGIQSNSYNPAFSTTRSGESSWDLVLVAGTGGSGIQNETIDENTVWNVFQQAGNNTFGPGAKIASGTLSQLRNGTATVTEGPGYITAGDLATAIFGATPETNEAKVTNVQFGIGSGQANGKPVLDWAEISFINGGEKIDFVDASTWTGAGGDGNFATAANWSGDLGPSATQNVVFADGTVIANVTADQTARSIAAGNGNATLALSGDTTLTLANDGFLSADTGAVLNLTGGEGSQIVASTVEAWGAVNIATNVTLHGGSVNQPVRNGRYAIVVAEGGDLTLQAGAEVDVQNDSAGPVIRVGELVDGTESGTLTVESGARLTIGSETRHGTFQVGDWGGKGVVNQGGGEVTANGIFNLGNEGGDGTYNLDGGTMTVGSVATTTANSLVLGRTTDLGRASRGEFNISGDGHLIIGNPAGSPSSFMIGGLKDEGSGAGTGIVNQDGGTVTIENGVLFGFGFGDGTYNLNDGLLQVGGANGLRKYSPGQGSYAFNFGGGTLEVYGDDLTTSIDANLVNGVTSYIDTNGHNATWSGAITSFASGLEKIGAGKLTFDGAVAREMDLFAVTEGEAGQTAGETTSAEFLVGTGSGNTGSFTLTAGDLIIEGAPPYDDPGATPTLRVGDWGGVGTFNQDGGTVTVEASGAFNIGNQGGTGTYNLNAGTVTLKEGNHVIARSATGKPASHGALNIDGGDFVLEADAALIIGNNIAGANNGTAVVNQTGGTLSVKAGADLYLAGFGNGSYNLTGGVLEIGGTSLHARYNSGTSLYEFNLGDATIRVIGLTLAASLNANLLAGTETTIDTNGSGAVWSGAFTGSGALVKTGLGNASFTGTNDFGTLSVAQGSASNGSGTTDVDILEVGAEGATGVFDLTGGVVNVGDDGTAGELTVGGGAGGDGTLNISGGTLNVGTQGQFGRFFVGAYDGTGVAEQSGGTVNVTGPFNIGNRGGKGTYHLSGGLLNVGQYPAAGDSNALILGRSIAGQVETSEGRLDVSGGTLVLNTNTPLLIGGHSGSTASTSTGYVTQTGGTVRVDSWIDLGSKGYGQYILRNSGVLEIGGFHTLRSSSGDYDLNLGGGTIKVVGSDFETELDAELEESTVSTIDTNGKNAILAGDLTGQGGLKKEGDGKLTLTGNNSYEGTTEVTAGTLSVVSRTGSGDLTIGADATLSGTGSIAGFATVEGTLAPGNSPGELTFEQGLTLTGSSTTLLEIGGFEPEDYDRIAVSGGILTLGGTLTLNLTSLLDGEMSLNLFSLSGDAEVLEGSNFEFVKLAGAFGSGNFVDLEGDGHWTLELGDGSFSFNTTTGQVDIAVVPEPGAWALLVSAAAAALAMRRRRQRQER